MRLNIQTPKVRLGVEIKTLDEEMQIIVWDHGIGIRPENISKLFTLFGRLDSSIINKIPGTGIGLNYSKKLVELHGGRIWAESEFGKGSRFIFTIPYPSQAQMILE